MNSDDTSPRVPLGEVFTDERGAIRNILELAEFDWRKYGRGSGNTQMEPGPLQARCSDCAAIYAPGIHGVAIIESKAGSVRSNHYHKTDYHWLYVLSGEAHYQERAVGESQYPPPGIYKAGEMFFTPPMREHRVTFPVDTILLSLSRYSRKHLEHEGDVVRVSNPEPSPSDVAADPLGHRRSVLIAALCSAVDVQDWHGVSDFANDLRVVDAQIGRPA